MVHDALHHIEKTLAESYRKEIDQEENVWRSLPFFATTVALQLATISQFINRLPPFGTVYALLIAVLLAVTAFTMLLALGFLIACIVPERFRYVSNDAALFQYADDLIKAEQRSRALESSTQPKPALFDAMEQLKRTLAHEYGVVTDNNRRINKKRELFRSIAGLTVMCSMVTTILSVAILVIYNYSLSP